MKKLNFIPLILLLACIAPLVLKAQNWQPLGPINRTGTGGSSGQGSGLVNTIAFHPKYNTLDASIGNVINKTIFIGSPFGGIWISRDDGANWSTTDPKGQYTNLSTDQFRGCGVVDIVIDYNNPTTMYASFSSSEYSDAFYGGGMNNYFPSTGIYKYTPANGWVPYIAYSYQSGNSVAALTISPTDPTIIFAATSDGVLKLNTSVPNSVSVLTTGARKPFRNVVFEPGNPVNVYAAGPEVYKSTNNGNNFVPISNFATLIPNVSTIIHTNIDVISATSVYARIHYYRTPAAGGGRTEAFYHYNGTTWTNLSMFSIPRLEYHYNRFPILAKKIGTTEYVFAGSEILNLYNSNSASWSPISDYNITMHADIHDIAFSPDGSMLMVAHDGGISSATSNFYSTPTWTTKNNGLNISTLISFAGSQKDPNLILTGEVDNGNSIVKNATAPFNTISWRGYLICDGGDKAINPQDPNDWYDRQQMYGGTPIFRNTDGNEDHNYNNQVFTNSSISPLPNFISQTNPHYLHEDFQDKKPLIVDPNNKNVVYRGANILIRSMDNGTTSQVLFRKSDCFDTGNLDIFSHTTVIAIAPSNSNYLYINSNNQYQDQPPFTNHIYKTTNALTPNYSAACPHSPANGLGIVCANWTDITPPFPAAPVSVLKKSIVNAIAVSDKDPNLIWAAFNYNPAMPSVLLLKYDGSTWSDYSTGLPPYSITSLVYEKGSNDGIYAGTDVAGVFYRNKSMLSWIPFGTGMPHALVMQLEVNNNENTLRAGTYGRGIWKSNLYCPTEFYESPDPCNECNSSSNYFWEGTYVKIKNTTLTLNKHFVRALDYIELLPNTTLMPSNANVSYDLFIHGCEPAQKNSYKEIPKDEGSENEIVVEEDALDNITVFPNPNNGSFNLNLQTANLKDVYVFNVLGSIVYQKTQTDKIILDIDLSEFPKGIYLLKVTTKLTNSVKTLKIITQ